MHSKYLSATIVSNESEPPEEEAQTSEDDGSAFGALLRRVARAPRVPAELLDSVRVQAGSVASERLLSARDLPALGDVVDQRYRIDSELGRGGMGIVFSARNLRTERQVALKWMLPRGLARSATERAESAQRFEREARAVGRVDHPNVVRVFDVGGDPDSPYLVMELLAGESLRALLARGPLAWEDALSLLLPAMSGVSAAHQAGVVHRDLKPDNIFVCREGVKVLDFGVSRVRGDEDATTLTRTGTVLGTPAYMPLEQLRGSRNIDERTDVYALGVILYEALSGRLPFEAHTAADQAVRLATQKPLSLGELVPALRGPRSDAVMKALALEPEQRYSTVATMADALLAARRARSSPAWWWAGVAAAALTVTGVWWSLREASSEGEGALVQPSAAAHALQARPPGTQQEREDVVTVERTVEPLVDAGGAAPLVHAAGAAAPAPSSPARSRKDTAGARSSAPRAATSRPPTKPLATALSAEQFEGSEAPLGEPTTAPTREAPKPQAPVLHPADF